MSLVLATHQALINAYLANRRQLYLTAYYVVGTAHVAEDVVQDAYLRILEARPQENIDQPFRYCARIVRNLALDYRRRLQYMEICVGGDDDADVLEMPTAATPQKKVLDLAALAVIDEVLSALPPRTRQVYEWYRLEGLTQRQIAARTGRALGLINGLIADANRALAPHRHLLNEY